jgi:hypothetical protein
LMIRRALGEAARQAARLYLAMGALTALFIAIAYALARSTPALAPTPAELGPLPSPSYELYQILIHVVSGAAAGAVSLDPVLALVGAGAGPLVDLDHLGFFAGLPIEARLAHSVPFVAALILVEWKTRFWSRGTRNFVLFITLQYCVHFAVAPPGFPLLSPLSIEVFYFPRWVPAALAVALAVAFFLESTGVGSALRLRKKRI